MTEMCYMHSWIIACFLVVLLVSMYCIVSTLDVCIFDCQLIVVGPSNALYACRRDDGDSMEFQEKQMPRKPGRPRKNRRKLKIID